MRLKWLFASRLQQFFQSDKFNLPVIWRRSYKVTDKTVIIICWLQRRQCCLSWRFGVEDHIGFCVHPIAVSEECCILRVQSQAWKRSDPVCWCLELAAVAYIRLDTLSQEPPRLNHPALKTPIRHLQVPGRSRGFLILAAAEQTSILTLSLVFFFFFSSSVFNLTA